MSVRLWFVILVTGFVAPTGQAHDWPRFLGPSMNGVYQGTPLLKQWPTEGPPVLWKKPVGEGYSSPVIQGNRLVLFQRQNDKETVQCLDAQSGKELWSSSYPTSYRDGMGHNSGPRATPAIDNNRVFTYGAEGMLTAWNLSSGKKLWNNQTGNP